MNKTPTAEHRSTRWRHAPLAGALGLALLAAGCGGAPPATDATDEGPPPVRASTTPAAPADPHDHGDSTSAIERITAEELHQRMAAGPVVVIDVRDAASYANGHIPGALLIPAMMVAGELERLPAGEIVTYCT